MLLTVFLFIQQTFDIEESDEELDEDEKKSAKKLRRKVKERFKKEILEQEKEERRKEKEVNEFFVLPLSTHTVYAFVLFKTKQN